MNKHTKNRIYRSFNSLLREMPFEKITVSMIAKKSDISNATFYRYFIDKYDVMNYHYKTHLDKWLAEAKCNSWAEFYKLTFTSALKDKKREQNALSVVGANSYSSFLVNYSYKVIESSAVKCRGGEPLTHEEELLLTVFVHGIIAVHNAWVNDELDYTLDEISYIMYLAMPETLRDLWWNPNSPDESG